MQAPPMDHVLFIPTRRRPEAPTVDGLHAAHHAGAPSSPRHVAPSHVRASSLAAAATTDSLTGTDTSLRLFVSKLPESVNSTRLREHLVLHLQAQGVAPHTAALCILDVYQPVGPTGRLRNFAFVSFADRTFLDLVLAHPGGAHMIDGRHVLMDVAAPRGLKVRQDVDDCGRHLGTSQRLYLPPSYHGPSPGVSTYSTGAAPERGHTPHGGSHGHHAHPPPPTHVGGRPHHTGGAGSMYDRVSSVVRMERQYGVGDAAGGGVPLHPGGPQYFQTSSPPPHYAVPDAVRQGGAGCQFGYAWHEQRAHWLAAGPHSQYGYGGVPGLPLGPFDGGAHRQYHEGGGLYGDTTAQSWAAQPQKVSAASTASSSSYE